MRGSYDSIIFDLDGTLWNACSSSARGWTKGLRSLGIDRRVLASEIESLCGLTYDEILRRLFSGLEIDFKILKDTLNRSEEDEVKKVGGTLYDNVATYIPILSENYKLLIVSNCQDWYLDCFLNHSHLKEYFLDWECHGNTGKSKSENLKEIILRNSLRNPIYVGDTPGDLKAAQDAGVDFHFASYGYQSVDFQPASSSFKDLGDFFTSHYLP